MIWGILAGLLAGGLSYRLRLLTLSGSLAAFALPIFGYGGWMWGV